MNQSNVSINFFSSFNLFYLFIILVRIVAHFLLFVLKNIRSGSYEIINSQSKVKAFLVVNNIQDEFLCAPSDIAEFCYARLTITVFPLTFAQGNVQDNTLVIRVAPDFLKFPVSLDIQIKILLRKRDRIFSFSNFYFVSELLTIKKLPVP